MYKGRNLIAAIDPSKFCDVETFKTEVDDFISEVKAPGNIFIPGEFMEVRNVKRYKENGIELDDKLLSQLKEIADEVSLNLEEIIGGK